MFFVSWSVSVFMVVFQPLSNRLSAENIAGEWGRGKHTYRRVAISPLCTILPQQHPALVHGDIIQVRDKQADGCSPMSRRLVCAVCLGGLAGTLRSQGGFPGKLEDLAWLVTMHQEEGGRGVSWKRRTAVTAHQWMAVVSRWALTSFPLGQDQVLDEDLNFQSVRHQLHQFV